MIPKIERPINIKDLVVDEPLKEHYVFRPENELSQKDIKNILSRIDQLQTSRINSWQYAQLLYQLDVLLPNIRGSLNLDDDAFEAMKRLIDTHRVIRLDMFIAEKFSLSAFPDRFDKTSHLDVQLAQSLEMIQSDIDERFRSNDFQKIENLASFKIIYPNAYKEFNNPKLTRANIVSAMSSFDEGLMIARNVRILFPNIPINDVIGDPTITRARRSFDWSKSTNQWAKAINEAFSLFILTAQDVRTGSGKLEVIPPKKTADKTIELPESRRY